MSTLPEQSRRVLGALTTSTGPLSGREVAKLAGLSPTSTNKELAALAELGAAGYTTRGKAKLWSATASASGLLGDTVEREAIVLTALPLEYAAMRDRLGAAGELRAPSGARYCEARLRGRDITWTVRVFETSMGNATAAAALSRAARDFQPDLVVFSGVAGGLRGDEQRHGDVVVVEHVYNGSSGKASVDTDGQSQFKGRPKPVSAPVQLVDVARSIRRSPDPLPSALRVEVVDLVSTETVEADPNNEFARRIKTALDNVRAIDMESFGIYETARQLSVPAITIRGLSDLNGQKDRRNDAQWQPIAARNSATVAVELLMRIHPGDLPVRPTGPEPDVGGCAGHDDRRSIPPGADIWIGVLAQRSQPAADRARTDLSRSDDPPRTAVNILSTHPPAWVREDRTGIGWAIVASVADAVGSRTAGANWGRAADTAAAGGDHASATLFRLSQARAHRGEPGDVPDMAAVRSDLESIDFTQAPALAPVIRFWQQATAESASGVDNAVLDSAGPALAALGRPDLAHRLGLTVTAEAVQANEGISAAREFEVLAILLGLSAHLLGHQDGRARLWAKAATDVAPWSSETQLRQLQVELQSLHDSLRVGGGDSVTDALVDIEASALRIRELRGSYGGPTGAALGLAGRARLELGDAAGALRMLSAAPRGTAQPEEARSPEVAQIAAVAALRLGEYEQAAELAKSIGSSVERALLRATTFSQTRNTHDLARTEYHNALAQSQSSFDRSRALAGLARLKVRLDADPELAAKLDQLASEDAEAADLIRATQALVFGDGEQSLRLARKYRSLEAIEAQADALSTLGRGTEAADVLDDYGRRTGDLSVRVQAMELAGRAGDWPRAEKIADAVIGEASAGPLRSAARLARADIAARAGQWRDVETQLRQVVREEAEGQPGGNGTAAEIQPSGRYAWQLAEAMFHQGKFRPVLQTLRGELRQPTTDPQKVRLVLAVLHRLLVESPTLIDEQAVHWVLAAATSMTSHEDIGASVIMLLLQMPISLQDDKRMQAGRLIDDYFRINGGAGSIRQLDLSSPSGDPEELNLEPLLAELRNSMQPSTMLTDLAKAVIDGRMPLGFLALAARKSYAELLLVGMLRQYVARPVTEDPQQLLNQDRVEAAKAALKAGRALVDTSALVLSGTLTDRPTLIAAFGKVLIPRSLQDDIYRARSDLTMRSSATMGWDQYENRPVLTEFDPDHVEAWAKESIVVYDLLRLLSPVDDAQVRASDPKAIPSDSARLSLAVTAVETARQLESALWADDAALLQLADSEGIPAFGTPELIAALRDSTPGLPSDMRMLSLLREHRVVDLPPQNRWNQVAQAADWDPSSYLNLAISRPGAWRDVPASFGEFQRLVRSFWTATDDWAADKRVATLTAWCEAACIGLGKAAAPPARQTVISALIAWTALNTEPMLDAGLVAIAAEFGPISTSDSPAVAPVLAALLAVSARIERDLFPGGNGPRAVITVLSEMLGSVSNATTAAAVLARAVSGLPDDLRRSAFAAVLKAPHHGNTRPAGT